MEGQDSEWVSAKRGAQICGIHWSHFPHVADAAGIRRRLLPGMHYIRYNLADIEKTVRDSVLPIGIKPAKAVSA